MNNKILLLTKAQNYVIIKLKNWKDLINEI